MSTEGGAAAETETANECCYDDFPFDTVIITFPDAAAAQAADSGPLLALRRHYPSSVRWIATADPYNARVGSGGGTLAALVDHGLFDAVEDGAKIEGEGSILILHAGGAASRCPTQMCLGKAWTSLPTLQTKGDTVVRVLQTPLQLWLHTCHELCSNIPRGTLVVIAADTLLQWNSNTTGQGTMDTTIDWTAALQDGAVLGLAVPAPLATAQNHGVFVPSRAAAHSTDDPITTTSIHACAAVLQKPSIATLQDTPHCCFTVTAAQSHQECAWIDTGVTIFAPAATRSLVTLARTTWASCTATGLSHWYATCAAPETLVDFGARHAVSVDLYTHVLHALAVSGESDDDANRHRDVYVSRYGPEWTTDLATDIYTVLSRHALHILAVPHGTFWHLGTTRELQSFLVDATTGPSPPHKCLRDFGATLGLTRRHWASLHVSESMDHDDSMDHGVDPSAVVYNSLVTLVPSNDTSQTDQRHVSCVGARSVVEHCHLERVQAVRIGSNCLVSGMRSSASSDGIVIPNDIMVQMVRLQGTTSDESLVVVVLGMDDNVKQGDTVYGQSMDDWFDQTGLCRDDVWDASEQTPTLWTARLHPVISSRESFASVFSWLESFTDKDTASDWNGASFRRWKSGPRLSLSEIRNRADAPLEFTYRDALVNRLVAHKREFDVHVQTILLERRHQSMEFACLVQEYAAAETLGLASDVWDTLQALDHVVLASWSKGRQDIGARACTLISSLLDDMTGAISNRNVAPDDVSTEISASLSSILALLALQSSDWDETKVGDSYSTLVSHRDRAVAVRDVATMALISQAMEELSSTLTGSHVLGARSMVDTLQSRPPIHDKWILATAPARIDLSGGWSDTPPICYEFGSLVTGMAVSLDGHRPLACRCRIVTGGSGILLQTEARHGQTGEQISVIESEVTTVNGMLDCRDPSADCALLKCVLVHLGLVPDSNKNIDFQSMINAFCQSDASVRIELVATTLLPHGSGLGTSSILAGCILAAVAKCIGTEIRHDEDLINSVLNVEQYLTTGGGFQDQVNGVIGGIKVVSSQAKEWPMKISFEKLNVAKEFQDELDRSLVLVFTGKTRLAKNLLKQVLQRWSRQTPEILATMSDLVAGAQHCRDAIISNDLNAVGKCLSKYWSLKQQMAGPTSGVEPPIVRRAIQQLESQGLIRGASLCGAGGGGFMVLLRSHGTAVADLQQALRASDFSSFTWHECALCEEGLRVCELDESCDFALSWLAAG